MFPKKTPTQQSGAMPPIPTDRSRGAAVPSIVSADMTFRGDLTGEGDVQIDGTLIGRIEAGHLVIAAGGRVEGEIVVKAVSISGTMVGTVRATTVKLSATARVQGDIMHEVLSIEAGAELEGHCRRSTVDPAAHLLAAPEQAAA